MRNPDSGRALSGYFVRLLTAVFAVFAFGLVLLGANVYKRVTDDTEAHSSRRVLTEFARTRLRTLAGSASVETTDGVTSLVLSEGEGGDALVTRIYCYEGSLCEQALSPGDTFVPADGEKLVPAAAFEPSLTDGLLVLKITDADGNTDTVYASYTEGGVK